MFSFLFESFHSLRDFFGKLFILDSKLFLDIEEFYNVINFILILLVCIFLESKSISEFLKSGAKAWNKFLVFLNVRAFFDCLKQKLKISETLLLFLDSFSHDFTIDLEFLQFFSNLFN